MTGQSLSPVAGIDVGKRWLDAHIDPLDLTRRFENTQIGRRALCKWLRGLGVRRTVFEPTGRYHRRLHQGLAASGCETVLVQPARARRFAQAFGKLAKTDRVDAAMLARLGRLEGMETTTPTAENLRQLKDLVLIRRRFVDERADLGKMASEIESKAGLRQVRLQLRCLANRVAALDRDTLAAIQADEGLARRAEILRSIPGLGPATVASLIANMPELGSLDRRAAAALLGTAPWANDSGEHQGRRHVRGGRAAPRRAMYMAALAAVRFNPPLRDFYRRLRQAGKDHNVALVAVMRKLVILANVLLHQDRLWLPQPPPEPITAGNPECTGQQAS